MSVRFKKRMKGNFLNRIEVDKSLRKTLLFHDAFPFCAQIFYIKSAGNLEVACTFYVV